MNVYSLEDDKCHEMFITETSKLDRNEDNGVGQDHQYGLLSHLVYHITQIFWMMTSLIVPHCK